MHLLFIVFIIIVKSKLSNTSLSNPNFNCSSLFPKGFCENYKLMNRTYLNDENILQEKILNYKENSKNGRIYLRKYFDTQDDYDRIGPLNNTTICKYELRVNYSHYDKIFCRLIVKYQRSYENLSELRKIYNIFIRSRKYYRDITDNYFDKTAIEIRRLSFPLEYHKCIDILSPIISRFFIDKKQNTTEDFCKFSVKFKRNYTTIDDSWSAIDYFTKRKRYYIKRLFDKNPKNIYKFSSINECINDFYWEKIIDIKKKFCSNLEKKNIKISIGNIVKSLKLFKKDFTRKYFKNANNNRLIQNDINAKLDISYKDQLTCMAEIKAVMLKYFKNKINMFNKINKFCINMILFNKTYDNVNNLIYKLGKFTKNMEKLKEYKHKKFSLTVHKSRFFDYSFDELENYNPGYKKPVPGSVKMNNITNEKDNLDKKHNTVDLNKVSKTKEKKVNDCYLSVNYTNQLKNLIDQKNALITSGKTNVVTSRLSKNVNRVFTEIKREKKKEKKLSHNNLKKRNLYRRKFKKFFKKMRRLLDTKPNSIIKKTNNCKNPIFLNTFKINERLLPKSLDYRKAGIVNPHVYDQGDCGSCWVFSLSGMIESGRSLRRGYVPRALSRQYFLDCVNRGSCKGGNYIYGLQFGIENIYYLEKDYPPYSGKKNKCKKPKKKEGLKYGMIKDFIIHKKVRSVELKYILLKGPIPVNIDSSPFEFTFYKKGILRYNCNKPNHSVLLIGWDRDHITGKEYWIIRNSWGKDWGNEGDAYIEMDKKWDACGMYKEVVELPSRINLDY